MMVGMPRIRSTYAVAARRNGVSTGPCCFGSRPAPGNDEDEDLGDQEDADVAGNPLRISGNDALKSSQLKNDSRTVGHPGELTTTRITTPNTTTVLPAPMSKERRRCRF